MRSNFLAIFPDVVNFRLDLRVITDVVKVNLLDNYPKKVNLLDIAPSLLLGVFIVIASHSDAIADHNCAKTPSLIKLTLRCALTIKN
uniref:Uncharacterized protein n=1 Tax=Moorena producens (strain JHB) TaxID=1454205 RepID=A0A1D9FZ93_MOOP1